MVLLVLGNTDTLFLSLSRPLSLSLSLSLSPNKLANMGAVG